MHRSASRSIPFVAAVAMLVLRALTPDGYMPATMGSGMLFALCPEGVPAGFMRALGGGHHDHHAAGDGASASGSEQCPIGHMLACASAADVDVPADVVPVAAAPCALPTFVSRRQTTAGYRSRAPPA